MLSLLRSLGGKGLDGVKDMSREDLESPNTGKDFFRFYEIELSEEMKQGLLAGYVLAKAHTQQEKERVMGMMTRLQNYIEETQADHVQGGKFFQLHHLLWLESWQRMRSNMDKLSNEQVQQVIFYPLIQLACRELLDETGKFNKDFLKMFFSDASPSGLQAAFNKQENIVASFVRLLARHLFPEPSLKDSPFIAKEVHKIIQGWNFYRKEKLPEQEKLQHWLQGLDIRIYVDNLLAVYAKQHQEQVERKPTKEEKGIIFKFLERLTSMRDGGELQISPLALTNLIVQSDLPSTFKNLAETVYEKLYSNELIRLDKENEAILNAEGVKAKLGFAVQGAVSYQRHSSLGAESPSSDHSASFFKSYSPTSSTDSGDSLSSNSYLNPDPSPRNNTRKDK
jgi:hypothetical protein